MVSKELVIVIIGSGAFATIIGYLAKAAFDRAFSVRLERFKESIRAEIQEDVRRKAALFDQQAATFKTVLMFAYKARNGARDRMQDIEAGRTISSPKRTADAENMNTFSQSLIALLYEERGIIPKSLFELVHELKGVLQQFLHLDDRIYIPLAEPRLDDESRINYMRALRNYWKRIDELYEGITKEVQQHLKVVEEAPNNRIKPTTNNYAV